MLSPYLILHPKLPRPGVTESLKAGSITRRFCFLAGHLALLTEVNASARDSVPVS